MQNISKVGFLKRLLSDLSRLLIIILCCSAILACVSTDEAQDAKRLTHANEKLAELLSTTPVSAQVQSKELTSLANNAYTEANDFSNKQQLKLALGFYQVASQGYWRDDESTNNQRIFEIAVKVDQICQDLGAIAPDRDCFISPLIQYLASVEVLTNNTMLTLHEHSKRNAAKARELLLQLGKYNSENSASFANGALSNLVNYANAHQDLLNNHQDLNNYLCANLNAAFDKYLFAAFTLDDYYKRVHSADSSEIMINIEQEHALYQAYLKNLNPENTIPVRVDKFVGNIVPSCNTL